LCRKKTKKRKGKKKSQSRQLEWRERKKIKNKKRHIVSACDRLTRVRQELIPAIWNGGNEENDKKNPKKWKWVILEFFFQRGSDLNFFLTLGSEKKFTKIMLGSTKSIKAIDNNVMHGLAKKKFDACFIMSFFFYNINISLVILFIEEVVSLYWI